MGFEIINLVGQFGAFGAESSDQTGHLKERRGTVHNLHMLQSDLLDELELEVLGHRVRLADPEDVGDDVLGGVAELPEVVHDLVGGVQLALGAVGKHVLDEERVGLVANLEHVGGLDDAEALVCRLEVVQGLPHVPLGGEDDGLEALVEVVDGLLLADVEDLGQDLGVRELEIGRAHV